VGGLLALLAALYEDNVHAVAVSGGLVSFLSVLRDRFCYVPQDIVVPGIFESADIEDIVAGLSPRAVLLDRLVDGRDRLLSTSDLEGEFVQARAAYRFTPSNLVIREQTDDSALVAWMAQQAGQR
jgi:ABC-type uncharacterized transport system permease subunit